MNCDRNGRYLFVCPYIRDRLDISTVSYQEAITSAIPPDTLSLLQPRIDYLIQTFPGSLWNDNSHQNRMRILNYELGYVHGRNTKAYYLFVLNFR